MKILQTFRACVFAHFILIGVVVLGLTLLVAVVDAQAQIAFSSDRNGNFEIYVIDTDGKKPQRLTNNLFSDRDPSWSPDGKRIIFESVRDDRNREIYVMDANGGNEQRLTNTGNNWSASWSPDGERIAFSSGRDRNWEIYVMDADGKNQRRLTRNHHSDVDPAWFGPAFAVTPAGKQLTIWGWLKQVDR